MTTMLHPKAYLMENRAKGAFDYLPANTRHRDDEFFIPWLQKRRFKSEAYSNIYMSIDIANIQGLPIHNRQVFLQCLLKSSSVDGFQSGVIVLHDYAVHRTDPIIQKLKDPDTDPEWIVKLVREPYDQQPLKKHFK